MGERSIMEPDRDEVAPICPWSTPSFGRSGAVRVNDPACCLSPSTMGFAGSST
jgi:hypothetical protein